MFISSEFFQILSIFLIIVTINYINGAAPTRPPVSDASLDNALSDKRYLMRQLKCALGEAPCDPVGRRLKSTYKKNLNKLKNNLATTKLCLI